MFVVTIGTGRRARVAFFEQTTVNAVVKCIKSFFVTRAAGLFLIRGEYGRARIVGRQIGRHIAFNRVTIFAIRRRFAVCLNASVNARGVFVMRDFVKLLALSQSRQFRACAVTTGAFKFDSARSFAASLNGRFWA